MHQVFFASLCYMGAHGGGILLSDDGMLFRTQKIQLPNEYKSIKIQYKDIETILPYRSLFVFPAVKVKLNSGLDYQFIIFGRRKFLRIINNKRSD